MATVLVIEDDSDVRLLLRVVLERADHRVIEAADGRRGLRAFHEERPDLVLVDIGLPEMEGWDVLQRIRELSDAPVILVTARSLETDKVRGLDAGADDFITKPFGTAELLARVNAALRSGRRGDHDRAAVFDDGRLDVDPTTLRVRLDGSEVALTPQELRLLLTLVRHADQVLSPVQLLEQAWDDPVGIGPDRVKFAVMRLRRKLHDIDPTFSPIESVRGFGYRYSTATTAGRPPAPPTTISGERPR